MLLAYLFLRLCSCEPWVGARVMQTSGESTRSAQHIEEAGALDIIIVRQPQDRSHAEGRNTTIRVPCGAEPPNVPWWDTAGSAATPHKLYALVSDAQRGRNRLTQWVVTLADEREDAHQAVHKEPCDAHVQYLSCVNRWHSSNGQQDIEPDTKQSQTNGLIEETPLENSPARLLEKEAT